MRLLEGASQGVGEGRGREEKGKGGRFIASEGGRKGARSGGWMRRREGDEEVGES